MAPPLSLSVTVVMPVYNEAATVAEVAAAVLRQPEVGELIVVDDGSDDGTWAAIEALRAGDARLRAMRHPANRGKGAALRTGFAAATGAVVVVQDADLEYTPSDYPALLAPIFAGRGDVVFSTRFAGAGAHRVLYFWHSVANKMLTLFSNMATDLNLTDMESGYKVFRREILERIVLKEDRFGIEPELVAKVARLKPRIYEVPVSYFGRTYADGKKIGWRDGVAAFFCIIKYGLLGL